MIGAAEAFGMGLTGTSSKSGSLISLDDRGRNMAQYDHLKKKNHEKIDTEGIPDKGVGSVQNDRNI